MGYNCNSGHYKSYFKKNIIWYCANYKIITRIIIQKLPYQPNINMYKEAYPVSLGTVEPLHIKDIHFQLAHDLLDVLEVSPAGDHCGA